MRALHHTAAGEAPEASLPRRTAARNRQRRHRWRLRTGRAAWCIEIDEMRLIEAMLAAGICTEAESLDRRHLERVLAEMVDNWSQRVTA